MTEEVFPDRRPCFVRPPLPPWDARITVDTIMPLPLPGMRWSWWCVEHFDPPRKVVCLHVMHGQAEYEARFNVSMPFYYEKLVKTPVHEPQTALERMEVDGGLADMREEWPHLSVIVADLLAYVETKHDLRPESSDAQS